MDPRQNPFAPGAGMQPPFLAGRNDLIARVDIALDRIRAGRAARDFMICGLKGVGKTILLNTMRRDAEKRGFIGVRIEVEKDRLLRATLVPALDDAIARIGRIKTAGAAVGAARDTMTRFVGASGIGNGDAVAGSGAGADTVPGSVAGGGPDSSFPTLLADIGLAAQEAGTALALFVDQMQDASIEEMAEFFRALHRVKQDSLPVLAVAAGLPQIVGQANRAQSYAERLFEYTRIELLNPEDSRDAIQIPIEERGGSITMDAVEDILDWTGGCPYFLQEWGRHSWDVAENFPIDRSDVAATTEIALAELANGFFRVRLDHLTRTEQRYLKAMATLGAGPHRSGEIAASLGKKTTAVALVRDQLITKGMIYSPTRGNTAFTAPLFDRFLMQLLPEMQMA